MTKPTRRPFCTCPACKSDYYTNADGAFYCVIDREWAAYSANQFIGAYEYQAQALEALAVYRIDQAAAEADTAHDVQQAATDSDVVAALVNTSIVTLYEDYPKGAEVEIKTGPFLKMLASARDWNIHQRVKNDDMLVSTTEDIDTPLGYRWIEADHTAAAATHAANAALSEYPTFTYSRAHRGFIYDGRDDVYQTQTEAALARDGK